MDCATEIQSSPDAPSIVSNPWSMTMLMAWSWGGVTESPRASCEYQLHFGHRDIPTASTPRK